VGHTIVGEDKVYPDRKLAIPGEDVNLKIDGIQVKDPTFGMDAVWISTNQTREAETKGYVVVAPESVLATHLSHLVYKYAGQLIGQDDVQELLDNLSNSAPSLVQSVVPKLIPLHNLTAVLRNLLDERVPIGDMRRILENVANLASRNLSTADMAEALRPVLAGMLIQQVAPLNSPLPVVTLASDLENMLITMQKQSGEEGLILDNELSQKLLTKLNQINDDMSSKGKQAVLVVSPIIRRSLSGLVRQHIDDMIVIGFTEIPDNRKIELVATITGEAES
ncbi:MAG: FHIPEP family type III secretion protein, partial [Candidatus Puniceispirillales bacterium]